MLAPLTFTSANTIILVNDKVLSGVYKIEVNQYAKSSSATSITLHRHIVGSDELINEMRSSTFTFKLLNNNSSAGYVAPVADVNTFHMVLSKEDDGKELLLVQVITITAITFLYADDARSAGMKATEEEDLANLINIIKENQAKSVSRVVLPTEEVSVDDNDLVWLNAKDPEQMKDVKSRKLKKNKTKRD